MAPIGQVPKRRLKENEIADLECTYEPITSLESLLKYSRQNYEEGNQINQIKHRDVKTVPLSEHFSSTKVKTNGQRFQNSSCAKLLVCHDFRGGYLDDKFVNGTSNPDNYIFRHWLQTDFFVYFSHNFVTIPPLGWINSAHSHGVKILGTIITEWSDGTLICSEMLKDSETIDRTVEKLTWITEDFAFDGYLINIENPIKGTEKLVEFLEKLTKSLKASSKQNSVIWYDSVTIDGDLKWQDELNDKNKNFFDVCSGIYLNYGWTEEKLQNSVRLAGDRQFDVFVGVDVFGRGCFGGGGLNTSQAVEKIAGYNLSVAVFAPGWSFEICKDITQYPAKDDKMWDKCAKYFYFSCWNWSGELRCQSNKEFQLLLSSDFSRGFGQSCFWLGEKENTKPWFNITLQSYQPILYNFKSTCDDDDDSIGNISFDTSTAFFGGGSIRLQNDIISTLSSESQLQLWPGYKIYIPLDISLKKSSKGNDMIALLIIWKKLEPTINGVANQIKIGIEVDRGEAGVQRVQFGSGSKCDSTDDAGNNFSEEIGFCKFLPDAVMKQIMDCDNVRKLLDGIKFNFLNNAISEQEIHGWNLTCILYKCKVEASSLGSSSSSNNETDILNAIVLGNDGNVCVGYFSLVKIVQTKP